MKRAMPVRAAIARVRRCGQVESVSSRQRSRRYPVHRGIR